MTVSAYPNVILINKAGYQIELHHDLYLHIKLVDRLVYDLGLSEEQSVEIPIGIEIEQATMDKIKEFVQLLVKNQDSDSKLQKLIVPGDDSTDVKAPRCFMHKWEVKFAERLDEDMLYNLMIAANYLEFSALLHLCTSVVANMIRGRSAEQVREILGIEGCDFSNEELLRIEKENAWLAD